MKVLLLTYGNESSIELVRSISELNIHEVYGCHYDILNAGQAYLNKSYIFKCPNPWKEKEEFVYWLNDFILKESIDKVFVTNCKMLKFLYDNQHDIKNVERFVIPDRAKLEPCLFKNKLYELLPDISPKVFKNQAETFSSEYVFIKPKYGSSAEGAYKVSNDVKGWQNVSTNDIVTEYLPGAEFTVDCVSTEEGQLVDWNVRERTRVRDGITSYGRSVPEKWRFIGHYVKLVANKLKLPYLWFVQFKLDSNGVPKLLEVNCRISGSFCITRLARKDYIKLVMSNYADNIIVKGPTGGKHSVARHMNVLSIGKKSWVWDIDGTICTETGGNYHLCEPYLDTIKMLNKLYDKGDEVVLHTARGMKRFNNDVSMVYQNLYELTKKQLETWGVRYDKLIMGKPYGTLVDTSAIKATDLQLEETI